MRTARVAFALTTIGILAASELFSIVTTVSPSSAGPDVRWMFFGCLYAISAVLCGFLWHAVKKVLYFRNGDRLVLSVSFRQAALFSGVAILALFFKSLDIVSVWDLIPLAVAAVLIELFFQADKSPDHHGLS